MGVNSLPKTVTRQRRSCDLNPGPSAPESSTLTTRLPSHPLIILADRFSTIFTGKFLGPDLSPGQSPGRGQGQRQGSGLLFSSKKMIAVNNNNNNNNTRLTALFRDNPGEPVPER